MSFSELLMRMVDGETLSPSDKQELMLEARRLEEVSSLVTSIIQPGSRILVIDGLVANHAKIQNAEIESATTGNGDVVLDVGGIYIKNNQEAAFAFEDVSGGRGTIYMLSGLSNEWALVNKNTDGEIILKQTVTGETTNSSHLRLLEDPAIPGAIKLDLQQGEGGEGGARFTVATGIDLRSAGSTGNNSTFVRVLETPNTPGQPGQNDAFHLYIKNDKLVIQYNDGGTVRYKYLDLTGTGVTWVHTTTSP